MDSRTEHVVIIENNEEIKSLIADQALIPLGYQVEVFDTASEVIQDITSLAPDLIISDLDLQGFTCKDLMIALATLGQPIPVIVIAGPDRESDILKVIRLGAADFLICPLHEAEVVGVVVKTLAKSRLDRQIASVTKQLEDAQVLLDQQRSDFSELYAYYQQALTSDDIAGLAGSACNLAMNLSQADSAWISSYDESLSKSRLIACQNLPEDMQHRYGVAQEDELGSLVAASGQPVSLHGEALARYKVFMDVGSALILPYLNNHKESFIIHAARKAPVPFSQYQLAMIELICIITSHAQAKETRKQRLENLVTVLQQANIFSSIESSLKYDLLRQASLELRSPLKYLMEGMETLLDRNDRASDAEQAAIMDNILDQAEMMMDIADSMINYRQVESLRIEANDLAEILRNSANRFRPIAQLANISISLDLPATPAFVTAYSSQITRVIEGLLSNALKYCPPNSEVLLRLEEQETEVVVSVTDQGNGMDEQMAERIFDVKSGVFGYSAKRFGGIGISLPRIRAIITAYNGRIWIEPPPGSGFTVKIALPRQAAPGK